ncbi:MAG TPA: prepilin peptidase [Pirellulales bacterium]|jgi:leader peptidase (prepilin peptidase)/N-methyltransferase|nr:prepilin peptidase [Pirellulales bacterium]
MASVLCAQWIAEPATARDWYVLVMLTLLGGAVGSFINVVVYRLPAGKSLLWPGSSCPRCGAKIRWLDNLPVLGWLKLRGRCRDCREPISKRYPFVELLTALVFLGLALVEPLNDAHNLPDRLGYVPGAAELYLLALGGWQLWGVYAYHLVLLCALECAMLLEYDGHGVKHRLMWPVWLVGWLAPLAWVQLRPIPAFEVDVLVKQFGPQSITQAWVDGLAGFAVGLVMGMLASPLAQLGPSGRHGVRTLLFASTAVGVFLGWQAGSILMVLTSVVFAMITVYRPLWQRLARVPFAGLLWIGAIVWIVGWRRIVAYDLRTAGGATGWLLACCGGIVLLASLLGHWAGRHRARAMPEPPPPT